MNNQPNHLNNKKKKGLCGIRNQDRDKRNRPWQPVLFSDGDDNYRPGNLKNNNRSVQWCNRMSRTKPYPDDKH